MTIVSGLLGVRPKRAPPGRHRSIGRFGSHTGLSRFACPKSRETVFSATGNRIQPRFRELIRWEPRPGLFTRDDADRVFPKINLNVMAARIVRIDHER
jgi:hypothetical protein